MRKSFNLWLLPLLLLLLPLNGCEVDLKPFATATTDMTAALKSSLDLAPETLRQARGLENLMDSQAERLKKSQADLDSSLLILRQGLPALDAYATTLKAIPTSEAETKKTIDAAGAALATVVSAVGSPIAGAAVGVATAIGNSINEAHAAHQLKQKVSHTNEAVQTLTTYLLKTYDELIQVDRSATNLLRAQQSLRDKPVLDYYKQLAERERVAHLALSLLATYGNSINRAASLGDATEIAIRKEALQSLKGYDKGLATTDLEPVRDYAKAMAALQAREKLWKEYSEVQRQERARIQPQADAAMTSRKALATGAAERRALLVQSKTLIAAWAKSHSDLQEIVERKQRNGAIQGVASLTEELVKSTKKATEKAEEPSTNL